MKQRRNEAQLSEREDMHLRMLVEQAVREGMTGRQIEELLKQTEARDMLRNWPLSRAA